MGYSPRGHKESDATEATYNAPTKSEVKVWVGPSGGPRENLFHASLLASSGFQQSLVVHWLVIASLRPVSASTFTWPSLWLCLLFCPLEGHLSLDLAVLSRSVMSDSATSWTVARQAPPCHGDSPGKNTGVGCHALLREIFPTQGLNPGLPYCRWILYHLSHQGNPLDLGPTLNPGGSHLKILNFVTSAETLFPHKGLFTSLEGQDLHVSFGSHHSPHYVQGGAWPRVEVGDSEEGPALFQVGDEGPWPCW